MWLSRPYIAPNLLEWEKGLKQHYVVRTRNMLRKDIFFGYIDM